VRKNLFKTSILLVFMTIGAVGTVYAETADLMQAGVAAAVKGEVKATTPPDTAARALKSGDKVFMGDKIETGADGQLQIMLMDQTVFTLGASGAITVDEFIYDPSNDDGKVKASVMKGIFRVVSGRVAHKKPENMSVDLPAGSIGFRGTNVAGIIDGQKTTVVLLGPVGVGRIYVTNMVNGEVVAVDIDEAGYATIVDGPDSAPVPVFQVSEADLARIAAALGQPMSGGPAATSGDIPDTAGGAPGGSVDTQQLLDLLNTVDDLNQTTMTAAQDKAQETAQDSSGDHSASNDPGGYSITKP
jgi:hypothetical protein